MAKAVSTKGSCRGKPAAQGRFSPSDEVRAADWSALGAFHAVLDPVVGTDAGRRVHALGGKAHDIDDLRLVLLLVETVSTVSSFGDALVAIADRKLDLARRAFEFDTLEACRHFVAGRLGVALLGFFVSELQAKQRHGHLV